MANTTIQIKRSTSNAAPVLQPGELAYTANGEILFIGSAVGSDTSNTIPIAGKRTPGTLTANQAIVANNSSWVDNLYTANLAIGTPASNKNITSITDDGNLASVSNNMIVTSWAIKDYVDNNSAAELSGLDDVDTTGIANNYYLVYDNTASKWEPHFIQGTANEVDVAFSNNDLTIGLPADVDITTSLDVGDVAVNTTAVEVGNSTVNALANSTTVLVSDATNVLTVNSSAIDLAGSVDIGNSTVNALANSTSLNVSDATNVLAVNSSYIDLGSGGTVEVGNSTVNVAANSTIVRVIDASSNVTINSTALAVGNLVAAEDRIDIGNSTVNTVITQNTIVTDGYLNVTGNATFSNVITVTGNASFSNVITVTGNATFVNVATFSNNVSIAGTLTVEDLTVQGTLTSLETTNLEVEDAVIKLAKGQANTGTFTDSTDIGFYGEYGNTTSTIYTGLVRDYSTNTYILFDNETTDPSSDGVDDASELSKLKTLFESPGLTSNTTNIHITANSTFSANLIANTLSLTSALEVSSGGTGVATHTLNGVIYGNGSNDLQSTAAGANGEVLQVSSNVPAFGMLDGGTF